jgi:hypothetical protein
MAVNNVTHHSVPEIVINSDRSEDRRIAFIDDYGGKIELRTRTSAHPRQARRGTQALLVGEPTR